MEWRRELPLWDRVISGAAAVRARGIEDQGAVSDGVRIGVGKAGAAAGDGWESWTGTVSSSCKGR